LDFGAFQGVFGVLMTLKIPFIVALLSLIYAVYLVAAGRIDFKSSTTSIFTILVAFIIIYSLINTIQKDDTSANLTLFLQYWANYIIMVACIKKPSQFILLIDIWLVGIIHSSYHAIMQGGKLYDSIWLRDENHISLICAYAIPLAFFLFMYYKNKLKKLCYLLALVFYVIAIVTSVSRGGLVAMVVVSFLCWLFIKRKMWSLVVILIGVVLVFTYAPEKFFTEAKSIEKGTEESTAYDRLYAWGLALEMLQDHPVLGVGPQNYKEYYARYSIVSNDEEIAYIGEKRVAHSTVFQWIAEMGIIGSILLLMLQYSLYKNWKSVSIYLKNFKNEDNYDSLKIYGLINHAVAITHVGFWVAALFLSLIPYPFYWFIIPMSEVWKNISLNILQAEEESLV